jgi:hypothetical protein
MEEQGEFRRREEEMEKRRNLWIIAVVCQLTLGLAYAAEVVPPEVQMPGTQPNEVGNFESPDKCDNCHGGYDEARVWSNEPAFGWRGGAMGNAGRDPIFWATLAIAEQDFDGAGDLCIRCHSARGWYGGRSTPTDGSGLAVSDDNGIDCDTCHTMTNPDNSDPVLQGVMNPGFEAYDLSTGEGYYGSGILSLWGGSDKLGPYNDAQARHQFEQSAFHRGDICAGPEQWNAAGRSRPHLKRRQPGRTDLREGGLQQPALRLWNRGADV